MWCTFGKILLVSLSPNPSSNLSLSWRLRKPLNLWKCCCFGVVLLVSNHKSTTSRQPKKVKFDMQAYFNPTKRNIKKKIRFNPPPPILTLYRVKKSKSNSRQPRRLKFDMQAYFNPTKRNMRIKNEVT